MRTVPPPPREHRRWHSVLEGYLFILPTLLGMAFFTLGPVLACFVLAFTRWNLFTPPEFIGMANFSKLSHDPFFWNSIRVTLTYAVMAIPLGLAVALGLALLVNHRLRGVEVYRTLFFLPNIVAGVAMMLVWKWMFNPDFGVLNAILDFLRVTDLLEALGLGRPMWIYTPPGALPSLVLMSIAGVGGSMMIFLAGLQNIPRQLVEAAILDGAGAGQRFVYITLPLLTPTIFFLLVVGTIGALQVFTEAFVMTEGGPAGATYFYGLYLYQSAFQLYRMGYACAMALILFVAVLALTLVQWRLSRRWVHYE